MATAFAERCSCEVEAVRLKLVLHPMLLYTFLIGHACHSSTSHAVCFLLSYSLPGMR